MRRMLFLFAFLVPLVPAAAGCGEGFLPDEDPTEPVPSEFTAARQRWNAQRIDDYRYRYQAVCFCVFTDEVVITVRDDRIVSVRLVKNGSELPRSSWTIFPTVDGVFVQLLQAEQQGIYHDAVYHPQLGYPMVATIGTLANDAGVRHHLRDLERID